MNQPLTHLIEEIKNDVHRNEIVIKRTGISNSVKKLCKKQKECLKEVLLTLVALSVVLCLTVSCSSAPKGQRVLCDPVRNF